MTPMKSMNMSAPLTLVLRSLDQFAHHGLDDTNIAIEEASDNPSGQGHREVLRESNDQERDHRADAAEQ